MPGILASDTHWARVSATGVGFEVRPQGPSAVRAAEMNETPGTLVEKMQMGEVKEPGRPLWVLGQGLGMNSVPWPFEVPKMTVKTGSLS